MRVKMMLVLLVFVLLGAAFYPVKIRQFKSVDEIVAIIEDYNEIPISQISSIVEEKTDRVVSQMESFEIVTLESSDILIHGVSDEMIVSQVLVLSHVGSINVAEVNSYISNSEIDYVVTLNDNPSTSEKLDIVKENFSITKVITTDNISTMYYTPSFFFDVFNLSKVNSNASEQVVQVRHNCGPSFIVTGYLTQDDFEAMDEIDEIKKSFSIHMDINSLEGYNDSLFSRSSDISNIIVWGTPAVESEISESINKLEFRKIYVYDSSSKIEFDYMNDNLTIFEDTLAEM